MHKVKRPFHVLSQEEEEHEKFDEANAGVYDDEGGENPQDEIARSLSRLYEINERLKTLNCSTPAESLFAHIPMSWIDRNEYNEKMTKLAQDVMITDREKEKWLRGLLHKDAEITQDNVIFPPKTIFLKKLYDRVTNIGVYTNEVMAKVNQWRRASENAHKEFHTLLIHYKPVNKQQLLREIGELNDEKEHLFFTLRHYECRGYETGLDTFLGKLDSLNSSWQSKEGRYLALGN
jgi:hypothetical protein